MKIGYLDLRLTFWSESYSIFGANRYGAGSIFAKFLKEFDNFYIFADKDCFDKVEPPENTKNCLVLTPEERNLIVNGAPIKDIIPFIKELDILIHCHCGNYINLEGCKTKQLLWIPGLDTNIHPNHNRVLIYNDYQPISQRKDIKIYKFNLGTKIPDFFIENRNKKDYIFQCNRHCPDFCSVEVAQFCIKNGIKGYFAGPIVENYQIKNYIDNKTTFYLGEITTEEKNKYNRDARLVTYLCNWAVPFNLSMVESLSLGTPVATTYMGFTPSLIKEGVNGFFCSNEDQLLSAYNNAKNISQKECYKSILKYNHLNMIESLYRVFEQICAE